MGMIITGIVFIVASRFAACDPDKDELDDTSGLRLARGVVIALALTYGVTLTVVLLVSRSTFWNYMVLGA